MGDRDRMVEEQIAGRGVRDERVLAALRAVPRDAFVSEALAGVAYEDRPLPIDEGQTISQPYIVALMAEALQLRGGERVLEVGTGSGYAAAVLGRLAREVFTIERHPSLAAQASRTLQRIGARNVTVVAGDGTLGLPGHAPFDGIVVAAAGPGVPQALVEQLADGGRLVIPVGERDVQSLVRVTRHGDDLRIEDLGGVRFVPLIGAQGWASGDDR